MKMNIKIAMILNEVINMLLNDENGNPRKLPFRLQLQLNRNKALLQKDVDEFNRQKSIAIMKYGKSDKDGNFIIEGKRNHDYYSKELDELLNTEVNHSVVKLSMDDLNAVTDSISLANEVFILLEAYLVKDDDFLNDIQTEIHFRHFKKKTRTHKGNSVQ